MMTEATELDMEDDGENSTAVMGSYGAAVRPIYDAAAEILVLWATNQPTLQKHNSFVQHSSHSLSLDACGHLLTILQSPSSMGSPGVTGAVIWDSGVILAKFMEHAVDSKRLLLKGKSLVELGSGCGLVGLKLLKKNVDVNVGVLGSARGSARVMELTWGDDLGTEFIEPLPDFVVGSDVIYSEDAVTDLLHTLRQLSGSHTTVFLAGELRNNAVLEFFLEQALQEFHIGDIDQTQWHPEYTSRRVALFVLVKKPNK